MDCRARFLGEIEEAYQRAAKIMMLIIEGGASMREGYVSA